MMLKRSLRSHSGPTNPSPWLLFSREYPTLCRIPWRTYASFCQLGNGKRQRSGMGVSRQLDAEQRAVCNAQPIISRPLAAILSTRSEAKRRMRRKRGQHGQNK